jgi:peptide/nickel transport system permease protein
MMPVSPQQIPHSDHLSGVMGNADAQPDATMSRERMVVRRFLRDWRAMTGVTVVALLFAMAYLYPFYARWRHDELDPLRMLSPPSLEHWFGTTQIGADMFALTMLGMQKSLIIGIVGGVLATAIASLVGAFAGYFGGKVNAVLTVLIDLLLVLPAFLIVAIVSPAFRDSTWLVFLFLLVAFQWMITARIVRNMTLSMKEREFVQAARYMGVSGGRIIFRHILPNMASILIIDATVNVSSLILAEIGLSFFGFGVQPPDSSLGTLIQAHHGAALTSAWQFYFPAGCLIVMVLAVNLIGDGLRDAFDPRAHGRAA